MRRAASLTRNSFSLQLYNFYLICFLRSLNVLLIYHFICYTLSICFILFIFDVSIEDERICGILCIELLLREKGAFVMNEEKRNASHLVTMSGSAKPLCATR